MLERLFLPGATISKSPQFGRKKQLFLGGAKSFLFGRPNFSRSNNFATTIRDFPVRAPHSDRKASFDFQIEHTSSSANIIPLERLFIRILS